MSYKPNKLGLYLLRTDWGTIEIDNTNVSTETFLMAIPDINKRKRVLAGNKVYIILSNKDIQALNDFIRRLHK